MPALAVATPAASIPLLRNERRFEPCFSSCFIDLSFFRVQES
jgi:hypothetical protein